MNKICDNCETVAHCMKNGCVPIQTHNPCRDVPIPDYMKVSTAPSYEFANGWNACVATIKSKLKEQNT